MPTPCSLSCRRIARETSTASLPSSIPGRTWQCTSTSILSCMELFGPFCCFMPVHPDGIQQAFSFITQRFAVGFLLNGKPPFISGALPDDPISQPYPLRRNILVGDVQISVLLEITCRSFIGSQPLA